MQYQGLVDVAPVPSLRPRHRPAPFVLPTSRPDRVSLDPGSYHFVPHQILQHSSSFAAQVSNLCSSRSMFLSRRNYLSLLGVVAWSATAANTTLDVLDATSLSVAHAPFAGLAVTSSVLDFIALGSVTLFSLQHAWTRGGIIKHSQGRRLLTISCVVLTAGAMIVSLVSIATIKTRRDEISTSYSRAAVVNWDSQIPGQIVAWVLACLSQIAMYSSPLWSKPKLEAQTVFVSGPRDSVMSEMRYSNTPSNLYMLQPAQPSSPLAALPSPTFSARSSNSLKSWRDSLQHAVRPVTSRTKLIKQPSFTRDTRSIYSTDNHSIENSSHPDGFQSWEVDPSTRDTVVQIASTAGSASASASLLASAPSRGTALEPIPGSRPASPARALDGPFASSGDDDDDDDSDSGLEPPPKMVHRNATLTRSENSNPSSRSRIHHAHQALLSAKPTSTLSSERRVPLRLPLLLQEPTSSLAHSQLR